MPFLRVLRDKRGYETTYLMHWYREGQRQRSKILYVFRTPGGVRVGRHPLDRSVQRDIEHAYPDIEFDWPAMLEHQQLVDSAPDQKRPRRRRREDDGDVPAVVESPAPPARPEEPAPQPVRPAVPGVIEGATPDEQIAFLTVWYPQLRERVLQRSIDPDRQQALLALVDRLNSIGWTDADQITTGLQDASEALERLSRVFARRRRRTRKGKQTMDASPAETATPASDSSDVA